MSKLISLLFITALFISNVALAGEGHEHDHNGGHSHGEISSDKAAERAIAKVNELIEKGKIDASWAGIKPNSISQKSYEHGPEWVITLNNNTLSDTSKQTLYLFFSLSGHYIAANYTGN